MSGSYPTVRGPTVPGAPEEVTPVRFVFRQLGRYRAEFVAALVWSIVFVIVPMQVPLLTGTLVNGITGQPASFYGLVTLSGQNAVITYSIIGLLLTAAAYGATAYLSTASVSELSRTFVCGLRKDLIRKLDTASPEVHARFGSGELLSRVIVDTQSTREFVENVFFNTLQNVVRVIYPATLLFLLAPWVAVAAIAILPVQYILSRSLQRKLRLATRQARTTQGILTASVKENLDGIEAIQTSNAEGVAIARISGQAEQLARDQISARIYNGLISGSTWALTSLGLVITWYLGGLQVLGGTMTLGTLVALTGYVVLLYSPMERFTNVANVYQKGLVAFERIHEVMEAPTPIAEDPRAPALVVSDGGIEFRDVSFAYGGRRTLTGVNLTLPPRRLTALVGRNGSGKSTVLKMISRLYDPSGGAVLVDGQDLRRVRLSTVRAQIAVVPQQATLFTGTIAENLRLGRPEATDAELVEACRSAGALETIQRLRHGFATPLGGGGTRLSGGEAQRIAIARALLRRPKILLLDEPNSALDQESEAALMATLDRLKGEMTIVLVVHHLRSVIDRADQVVVMESGGVVGAEPRPRPSDRLSSARSAARELAYVART